MTFNFKAFVSVMPFILKGKLTDKHKNSPVYHSDGRTPITTPIVLTAEERFAARSSARV